MHRWIAALILVLGAVPAGAEETRRALSVTATVADSCSVSTTRSVGCTRGTRWTSSVETANRALQGREAPTRQSVDRGGTSYLTISY